MSQDSAVLQYNTVLTWNGQYTGIYLCCITEYDNSISMLWAIP
jgi:hypothetical protein